MNKKFIKSSITVLIIFTAIGCPRNPAPNSFTADIIQKTNNHIEEGKIFVKENEYRMDINERGKDISILVNHKSGKQKIVVHYQKSAREVLNTSTTSLSNNLFEFYNYLLQKYSSRIQGSEIINGYECKKIEIYDKDNSLLTAWISDSLNWPLKIKTHKETPREIELKNIKEGPIEEKLFELPEDYKFTPFQEANEEKVKARLTLKEINSLKESVKKKLEVKGIELENADGTIEVRRIISSTLTRYFPDWYIFFINREKIVDEETIYGYVPFEKALVSADKKEILIIKSPEKDTSLTNEINMLQKQKINLTSEKEIKDFGKVLVTLYFRNGRIPLVESLGKNKWALYNGMDSGYLKGFIIKLDDNGEIEELDYKLKIKKQ